MLQRGTGERFKYKQSVLIAFPLAKCIKESYVIASQRITSYQVFEGPTQLSDRKSTAEQAWTDAYIKHISPTLHKSPKEYLIQYLGPTAYRLTGNITAKQLEKAIENAVKDALEEERKNLRERINIPADQLQSMISNDLGTDTKFTRGIQWFKEIILNPLLK